MSVRRRIIFWIFLCLFSGLIVFYLAWVPYQPANLYRAIPAQAMLVSSHQNLAGRWHELATNVIIKAFITPSAMSPDQQRKLAGALKMRQWISRLARKETVIAYVPALSPIREPIWVFASWIGSASQYLRWLLCVKHIPGLDRMANYCAGRPIWSFRQPLTPSGLRLSLAFGEGIFLACLSRNPDAMQHVIMAYEGLAPSIASSASIHPATRPCGYSTTNTTRKTGPGPLHSAHVRDHGWLRWLQPGKKLSETLMMSYAIPRLNTDYLLAEILIEPEVKPRLPISETMDLSVFEQLLGDIPALVAMIPLDITRDLLDQAPPSPGRQLARQTLQAKTLPAPNNSLVITLLSGDYSGGLGQEPWRVKVPALMTFVKLRNTNNVAVIISGILDHLNAHYRLGLIIDPTALPAGKINVHVLEATLPNILSALAVKDRPAYAVIGPWLVLSSNAQSLLQLLKRYQDPDARPGDASPGRWQTKLTASKACALLWMDLDVCGRVLQLPLTCLRRTVPSASVSSSADMNMIETMQTWLEDVRPLKTGVLWMDSGTPAPGLHLEIGEQPTSPGRPD